MSIVFRDLRNVANAFFNFPYKGGGGDIFMASTIWDPENFKVCDAC